MSKKHNAILVREVKHIRITVQRIFKCGTVDAKTKMAQACGVTYRTWDRWEQGDEDDYSIISPNIFEYAQLKANALIDSAASEK